MSTLMTLILIVALSLGGTGATVYASQNSQPDEPLYGLKLASEEARYSLATSSQTRLQLMLDYTDRRAGEMVRAHAQGDQALAETAARWEHQVQGLLKLAAGMPDVAATGALLQIQGRLRIQEQLINQDQVGDPVLQQVRTRLQQMLKLVDECQGDPQAFRTRLQEGDRGAGDPRIDEEPSPGGGYGPGPDAGLGDGDCQDPDCQQGGAGPGPDAGPGECQDPECPQNGTGPGPQEPGGEGIGQHEPGSPGPQDPGDSDYQQPEPGMHGLQEPGGNDDTGSDNSGGSGGSTGGSGGDSGGNNGGGGSDSGGPGGGGGHP